MSAETLVGLAIFFSPSVAALIYAYVKGKGNIGDGLSRLLTDVSQVGQWRLGLSGQANEGGAREHWHRRKAAHCPCPGHQ